MTDQIIEQNVIGAIIIHPQDFKEVSEIVTEKDFKIDLYRRAFITIKGMAEKNIDLDLSSLYMEMGRPEHTIEKIAASIDDSFLSPIFYANQLKKRNLEDEIKRTANQREFEQTKERIKEIEALGKPVSLYSIQKMIEEREDFNVWYNTGFKDLDRWVKFRPGDLMVIAGKPSVGKSSFGLSILANMAKDFRVGLISFEMSLNAIGNRLCQMYAISYLNEINDNLKSASPSSFTINEVRKCLKEITTKWDAKVILVDYLQLMESQKRSESRRLEITSIIRGLKELGKEFGVGMMVISSLSRNVDHRGEESKPQMSDLRESGDIEYAADIILFLHKSPKEDFTQLLLDKNRNGKSKKMIELVWLEDKVMYGPHYRQENLPYKDED